MAMRAIVHYPWLFIECEHPQELNRGRDSRRTMGLLFGRLERMGYMDP